MAFMDSGSKSPIISWSLTKLRATGKLSNLCHIPVGGSTKYNIIFRISSLPTWIHLRRYTDCLLWAWTWKGFKMNPVLTKATGSTHSELSRNTWSNFWIMLTQVRRVASSHNASEWKLSKFYFSPAGHGSEKKT